MAEYPLRASHKHPDAYDIFQVSTVTSKIKVSGTDSSPGSRACLAEFESFQHQMEYSRQRKSSTGITGLKRPCFTTGLNIVSPLSMQTVAFRAAHGLNDDVITTSLICTNRMILPGCIPVISAWPSTKSGSGLIS